MPHAGILGRRFRFFQQSRCAGVDVAGKQHRGHAAAARAIEFLGEVDGGFQSFAAALVVPVIFQPALSIVKEG